MLGLVIGAVIVGLIIGALGRLVFPGYQDIPIWLTILIGIVAAGSNHAADQGPMRPGLA